MTHYSSPLLLALVLSLVANLPLWAQRVAFETVSLPLTLEPSPILDLQQDRQGYLWVATVTGLLRYNGYDWMTYQHDSTDIHSLALNDIESVCPTRDGLVWAGTWGMGLDCLNPETGKVTHYKLANRQGFNLEENIITDLLEDRQGTLWIGTHRGLYRRDAKTGRFFHYASIAGDSASLSHPQVEAIYEDRQGTLWVGTGAASTINRQTSPQEGGLNRLDPQTGRFTRYVRDPDNAYSLVDNRVQALFEDSRGTFWVATVGDGLHTMDRKTGRFTHYPYQAHHPEKLSRPYLTNHRVDAVGGITCMEQDREGALWIGSSVGGASRYDPSSGQLTHFEAGVAGGLPSNSLLTAFRSWEGVLWLGTANSQLVKVVSPTSPVTRVATPMGVHAIHQDPTGTLWLGTVAGLMTTDSLNPASRALLQQAARQTRLLADRVTGFFRSGEAAWWMSTWSNGLYRYDLSSGQFTHFQHDSLRATSLSPGLVANVYQDRAGTLWVLTEGGLDRMDAPSGHFTHYRHDARDTASLSSSACIAALEDRTGTFWVGTLGDGLNQLNRRTGQCRHFLPGAVITQLLEDAAGTLWVAANDRGLYRFDRPGNRFRPFVDPQSGKPLTSVRSLQEDATGHLWASSGFGLVAISPRRDSLLRFGASYGIRGGEEFYFATTYKSRDGSLFFGGEGGYFRFRPEQLLRMHSLLPQLLISALRVHNLPVKPGQESPLREGLSLAKTIHLSHHQNVFSLDFAGIDYRSPQQLLYSYMLEHYDADWRPVSSERTANYYDVPPGKYVFRVKASNGEGGWVEKSIAVLISPPWWRTTGAYTLYALALAGLLYGVWQTLLARARQKNERKLRQLKAEQLLEMDRLKSQFFANLSHEFRTPLTLLLAPLDQLITGQLDASQAPAHYPMMQRNARRLLQLVNQLLDLSKLEAGKMILQAQPGDLVQFFRRTTAAFLSLAEAQKVHFRVHAPADNLWVCFDADKLEKILGNLLSNAFKFTPSPGEVSVSLRLKTAPIHPDDPQEKACILAVFSVHDTGIGIAAPQLERIFERFHQVDNSLTREREGTGIGLSLTRELVELHRGTLAVASEPGKGSQFTVSLPLELVHPRQLAGVDGFPEPALNFYAGMPGQAGLAESADPSTPAEADSQPLVLLVEDNGDLRGFLRQALIGHLPCPYRVIEATNGLEGYRQAAQHLPDLIVSDVMMPKMDGFRLCQKLKTDEKTSHIPVVLLTAKASVDSRVEGLETGADDYLSKPFQVRELLARINNLIEGRRKLRERFSRQVVLQPRDLAITTTDEQFLNRAMAIIEQHLGQENFSVDVLGREAGMSRTQLYRKLQALTGQSPSDFIRTMRLQRGAQLLVKGSGTVSEISYQVGFSSHSYFSKCFAEQYGQTPSEYVAERTNTF